MEVESGMFAFDNLMRKRKPAVTRLPRAWWGSDRTTLSRVLAHQLHAEFARLRLGGTSAVPPWLWNDGTGLSEMLGDDVDSLDLMSLSAAVAELLPGYSVEPGLIRTAAFGAWCAAAANSVRDQPTTVTFRSSGSTGISRSTTHPLAQLEEEAASLAILLGNGRRRVLSAVPAHHAYGFIHSVLLPRHLGGLPLEDLRHHNPSELTLQLRPGDLVLGHPAFWHAAVRGMLKPFPADVVAVTSSAPCPPATALDLERAGLARLVQVYGTSETAGIGWRDDPLARYTLLPAWQRDGHGLKRDGQPVEPPDRLDWDGNDRFHVLGRHDQSIQIGGLNVDPKQVRDALSAHPEVACVAVQMMRADEGQRLKAFVVPRIEDCDRTRLRADLRRFATAALPPQDRPGAYSFGPALPVNDLGKAADWLVV